MIEPPTTVARNPDPPRMFGRRGRIRAMGELVARLGIGNVAAVLGYRTALRTGIMRLLTPPRQGGVSQIMHVPTVSAIPEFPFARDKVIEEADELCAGRFRLFFGKSYAVGSPPDWFLNPNLGKTLDPSVRERHWAEVEEFALDIGDIKTLWDISRFGWAPVLARAHVLTGDTAYLETLNYWVGDWCARNPVNAGPNWRCGQEASLRLLSLLTTAELLGQIDQPSETLIDFASAHCARIGATLLYGLAQDNNHGTSEAAALFVGGAFLASCEQAHPSLRRRARRWERRGRFWLENRAARLIQLDGSFAQHSVIYHRLVLDTLSTVEHWRRRLALPAFSTTFVARARAAVDWLFQMTDPVTGEAPNLGANDGSRFLRLCSSPYRDNRSSIQLAAALFLGGRAYHEGPWDEPLFWLGHEPEAVGSSMLRRSSRVFPDGGYVTLHGQGQGSRSWAMLRFPVFRFRPAHADAMHLDLWWDGRNILRDGGSYSYADTKWNAYFSGTASHNTVQIDRRDQMPRIGRFLFGSWLKPSFVGRVVADAGALSWTGEYRGPSGARHRRSVYVKGDTWRIQDEVDGQEDEAIIRWRLIPADWVLNGSGCSSAIGSIKVKPDVPIRRLCLGNAWTSEAYMERATIPCLELTIGRGKAVVETEIKLGKASL